MKKELPYFDYLLKQLDRNNAAISTSFGRHVHWGYWSEPEAAVCDDQDYARAAEQLSRELYRLGEIGPGERVLDVGCGFGGTVASLNESMTGMALAGLNIDGRQLQRARQMVQPMNGNQVDFCQGDACNLPFADATFDRLLAVECIFHFPSREKFLREAFRVLRPGGTLALSDFVPSPLFLPFAALSSNSRFNKFNYFGHCDVRCTLANYRRLAERSGLVIQEERNVTAHILPTYRYLQNLLKARNPSGKSDLLIGMLRLLGTSGLLNYYLLGFRKP